MVSRMSQLPLFPRAEPRATPARPGLYSQEPQPAPASCPGSPDHAVERRRNRELGEAVSGTCRPATRRRGRSIDLGVSKRAAAASFGWLKGLTPGFCADV